MVDAGRILFCGRDVARLTDDSVPFLRRNIGIVFQDFKVVPTWTVYENVAIALEVLGLNTSLVRQRVLVALDRVGLAGRGGDRAGVLSGGEQQRVAIARAIVGEPALVLADEPTGNLDPALALDILGLFEEIHAAGTTVVFATHDRTLLDVQARRILVVDEGRVTDVRAGLDHFAREIGTTPGGTIVEANDYDDQVDGLDGEDDEGANWVPRQRGTAHARMVG
jgi:cell division transport system ATP-binding protein